MKEIVSMGSTPVASTGSDPVVMIALALIAFAGICVTGWFSYKGMVHARGANKSASEANDAVNHRQPGQERLFDMVADTRAAMMELAEWKDKWDAAASHVADPNSLQTHLAVIEDRIKVTSKDTTDRIMRLHTHVDSRIDALDHKVDLLAGKTPRQASDGIEREDK